MRWRNQWLWLGIALGILCAHTVVKNFRRVSRISSSYSSLHSQVPTLVVSELPGYTGWARSSSTLAGLYRIRQQQKRATATQNWTLVVTCENACSKNDRPWFYVRAYGPAILNGIVERKAGTNDFAVTLHPLVAGQYTVEVVLTYSHPIDPDAFPLTREQLPPPYFEGYMLPEFPLQLNVAAANSGLINRNKSYCTFKQLTVSELSTIDTLCNRAAWRVKSTVKQASYAIASRTSVTLEGYQRGQNSLGFAAAYEYKECRLIEHLTDVVQTCDVAIARLHFILIGDSVMRLQKEWIENQLGTEKVKVTFMELFGGALRCSRLSGPNVTQLYEPMADYEADRTIVIFNTGMHDIHRLCGHHWIDDRPNYLTETELQLSCTAMYRTAIRELVAAVQKIPAVVRMFQTTTAAWPKYGNYGVAWDPRYAQELPLDSAFVERFNQIAMDEIHGVNTIAAALKSNLLFIVDAYWITLARPDNREVSKKADIGRKLSHPGLEVISHMVRIWWQAAWELLCVMS